LRHKGNGTILFTLLESQAEVTNEDVKDHLFVLLSEKKSHRLKFEYCYFRYKCFKVLLR